MSEDVDRVDFAHPFPRQQAQAESPSDPSGGRVFCQLKALLEATPDLIATLDPQGGICYLNAGGRLLLGYPDQPSLVEQSFTDILADGSVHQFRDEAMAAAAREGLWQGEARLATASQGELPVDLILVAHRERGDMVAGYSVIARDISRQKREEERLRDSEEKYRRILEAAQEGFLIVNDHLNGKERPQLRYKVPVSRGSRVMLVDLPEVRYFQADGHYTRAHTGEGAFLCNLSVSELEERLDATQFVRVHRSFIVNLRHLHTFERSDDQWIVTAGAGERIPVSRRNVEKVKVLLGVS